MRSLVPLLLIVSLHSCNKNPVQKKFQESPTNTVSIVSEQTPLSNFNQVKNFKPIKDSAQFIGAIARGYHITTSHKTKITAYKRLSLYGTDDDIILVEINHGDGSTAEFPWKSQLLFKQDGTWIATLQELHYVSLKVFSDAKPFLLTYTHTGKGNGRHSLFKFKTDRLENVYEGLSDWFPRTYDVHEDETINEPAALTPVIKDYNNDGYNDLSFNGNIVLIRGYSKEIWYDSEIINNKTVVYSKSNPFKKIPVELIFLFDPVTGHFIQQEDYSKNYLEMLNFN